MQGASVDVSSRFSQLLVAEITKLQDERAAVLCSPALLNLKDPGAIAVEYARCVGYISALGDILKSCEHVFDQLNAGK